ncbi:MAG TPA: lytic transglycosylase domain-containing protein [Syntrophorhabdaceae bacterium]|nr:lytic transglycosylase domain-containing protein [Syntrophorhabdaceae bacterium]
MIFKTLIILALCLLPLCAYPAIYGYVDDNGTYHFTNMIPVGKKFRVVISDRIKFVVARVFNNTTYDNIIHRHAITHGVDPTLIKAVMKAESNFNPNAMSYKGAQGLMQLMPDTAKLMKVDNPFDPDDNIRGGTRYLKYLGDVFGGNLDLVLAAYNAGPGRVKEYKMTIPPYEETRTYIQRVKSYYNKFKKDNEG